jgi:hypothetical protein
MFWRVITPPAHVARRTLGLVRAALAPEPSLRRSHELAAARTYHPHRTELRAPRARHRGGAVLARPQHCITPLVRSAPRRREPASRR